MYKNKINTIDNGLRNMTPTLTSPYHPLSQIPIDYIIGYNEVALPTLGFLTSTIKGFEKCVLAEIDSLALIVRMDETKLFSKLAKAVARCQNLLIIGLCFATIFGGCIYLIGKGVKISFYK